MFLLFLQDDREAEWLSLILGLQLGIHKNSEDSHHIHHDDCAHGMMREPWEESLDRHHETRDFSIRARLVSHTAP